MLRGTSGLWRRQGRQTRRGEAGFTLVEILVVLAILGLIFGLVGPRVVDYFSQAKVKAAGLQIQNLEASLDLFKLDVGRYPAQEEGLEALVRRPSALESWHGPYLKGSTVPNDPWGRPYRYRVPSQHGQSFDLYSIGPDATEDGTGSNRGLTNW